MNNGVQVLKKSETRENITRGILICISCGSGRVDIDADELRCLACSYANSYEAMS